MLMDAGRGIELDAPDSDGRTPLHWAAFHGNHRIVNLLLSAGASILVRDNEGRTSGQSTCARSLAVVCFGSP